MATKLLNLIQVFFLQEEDCYGMVQFSVVLAFDFDLDLHLPIKLSHNGITEGKSELEWVSEVKDDIEETVNSLSKNQLTDDKIIEDKVRSSIRSVTKLFFNIKPLIDVHIIRGL